MSAPGALYVVATPIGNLEDITLRALGVLRQVDLVVCEDTRRTGRLLAHYSIEKKLLSYHEHNEAQRAAEVAARLAEGLSVALVSDAGTPLISDPGYRLVKAALEKGFPVVPIPGPSAVLAALSASGLASDAFYFAGFLPPKRARRRKLLEELKDLQATLAFYEAPHRILETLTDIQEVLGSRQLVLARELTKLHEEFLRGAPEELRSALAARPSIKGEFTVLVARAEAPPRAGVALQEEFEQCLRAGMTRLEAIKCLARRRGFPKREVYKTLQQLRR